MGDTLLPPDIVEKMLITGKAKAEFPAMQLIVRGMGAGALLAVATTLSMNVWAMEQVPKVVGDIIFPIGFVVLMLTGKELVTGNFALLPMAALAGRIRVTQIPRAWACVLLGNLIGSVLYGILFYFIYSDIGAIHCSDAPATLPASFAAATKVCQVASGKTFAYEQMKHGRGWAKAFFKAIVCNWLVCYGTMLNFSSQSTIGRIAAMWLPIFTFFSLGYEHLIVNLFVIPTAMMLDAPHVNFSNWILWNFFPVTLGNMAGGFILAIHHWYIHAKDPANGLRTVAPVKHTAITRPIRVEEDKEAKDGVTDSSGMVDLATPTAPVAILPVMTSIATTPDNGVHT